MNQWFSRRNFLKYSLATGVVIWAGEEIPNWLGVETSEVSSLFAIEPVNAATAVFAQSVASGDPETRGITLWTRVTATAAARVAFEISSSAAFSSVVLRGVANTDASRDYTVKVQARSRALQPFTTYYYRFIFNGTASKTGRFKTLPAPNANVDQIRFGYISCQDYTNGYYNALAFLAQENIDFVVHLGDYIYETVDDPSFQGGQVRTIKLPSGKATAQDLADYRFLYKTYRSDANLQRLHENFAFITIWDDHEFANDAYRQYTTETTTEAQNRKPGRRQFANRAWAEYIPSSVPFESDQGPLDSLKIYRSFVFGKLLELVMTDERLYRDGPPCGLADAQRSLTPGCTNLGNPQRTMLGSTQKRWFLDKVTRSSRIWKIWGNEVMTMQFKVLKAVVDGAGIPGVTIPADLFATLDQWDGYPAERAALLSAIRNAGVKNFVTITGDLHTYLAGYQRVNFDAAFATSDAVGIEFVGGSVTSSNLAEQANAFNLTAAQVALLFQASNPHIQYFNSVTHGYNIIDVTSSALVCTMKAVSTITTPGGSLSTLKTFRVPRDQTLLQVLQ